MSDTVYLFTFNKNNAMHVGVGGGMGVFTYNVTLNCGLFGALLLTISHYYVILRFSLKILYGSFFLANPFLLQSVTLFVKQPLYKGFLLVKASVPEERK